MNSKNNSQIKSSKIKETKPMEVESININNSPQNNNQDEIFVLINKNTEKLMDSKKKSDLIQCALEYNSYVIENLIKEKDNLNQFEYDTALNRLYSNLSILTENFELYEDKYKLIDIKNRENKENDRNGNKNIIEHNNINTIDRIYCTPITNIEMELPL